MQYEKRTFNRVFYSHMFGPVPQSLCNIYLSATGPAVRGGDLHPGVLHVWSSLHRHQQLPQLRHLLRGRAGVQADPHPGIVTLIQVYSDEGAVLLLGH